MAGRGVGRPTKLTDDMQAKLITMLRAGAYIEQAAAACGINKDTLFSWMRDGARSTKGKLRQFSDAVHTATAESEIRDIARIDKAITDHWQAAAWKLERRYPERWALVHRVRIETEKQIDVLLDRLKEELPPATYRQVLVVVHRISETASVETDSDVAAGVAPAATVAIDDDVGGGGGSPV